ncbi:MerR family transcriptional regulator [Streptomyces lydicus]|uniref:MerR family transcriptional regulator n=1 Tax=Streptomyces lydicus TaxID=47763 RepID=UPI0037BC68DE
MARPSTLTSVCTAVRVLAAWARSIPKDCLREGLLQPGRRVSATQAEYGEDHLRRLRLVRALIQIGGVPVAAAREVIAAAEDESLDHHLRLGAATRALPCAEAPAEDDPAVRTARRSVEALLERLGWSALGGPGSTGRSGSTPCALRGPRPHAPYRRDREGQRVRVIHKKPPSSATEGAPNAFARGAAESCPTGMAMKEPRLSYDEIRAMTFLGICSCSVLSQATL